MRNPWVDFLLAKPACKERVPVLIWYIFPTYPAEVKLCSQLNNIYRATGEIDRKKDKKKDKEASKTNKINTDLSGSLYSDVNIKHNARETEFFKPNLQTK